MENSQPQHTNRQYEEELRGLRAGLLKMGGLVERQIAEAVDSLVNRNTEQARETIARDVEVNRMDTEMDERCIRLLALHQPAASDLRFITTGLKITTDLERIGDNAVNICERAVELNQEPQLKPYIDIPRMAEIAQTMVKDSLDAFMRDDTTLAEEVIARDDEVDQLNYQIYRELLSYMAEDPQTIPRATRDSVCLEVSRTDCRPCDQHRRDGRVHGEGEDHPAHGKEQSHERDYSSGRSPARTHPAENSRRRRRGRYPRAAALQPRAGRLRRRRSRRMAPKPSIVSVGAHPICCCST